MKNQLLVGLICLCFCLNINAQDEKDPIKGIIKTEISGVASEFNFYQLGYEFNIDDNSSFQVAVGYGSESGVDLFAASIQNRYYMNSWTNSSAPEGFHLGPRVMAIYAESKKSDIFTGKSSSFGFEIDGILGYQFILGNIIAIDPYIGAGLSLLDNQTQVGFIYGGTIGVAF